ncbi:DUF1289 domain-containing protein [Alcanivorax sp. JB21]|uniref:DUF1289 domain-containing protein n=1 Tax=Alcanivorax limicola TaxID=2874102 RepID=UPI001CBA9FF0|nr:DUF1289 domain-containing protein [Alcanivorax limicola]MBZ2189559.1 DUF1289 domain-containing protein [Alcanivorax limicola]
MSDMVASPCVSICALDGDDICVGCFRTGSEISYWGRLPASRQREVLVRCQQRMYGAPAACVVRESGIPVTPG